MENNEKILTTDGVSKKQSKSYLVYSVVSLCLVCAILLSTLGGCAGCSGNENTDPSGVASSDEAETLVVDEATYIFSDGIYIGKTSLGGHSYAEARLLAQTECDSMIHDFDLTVKAKDNKYDYNKSSFQWDNDIEDVLKQAASYNNKLSEKEKSTSSTKADKVFELSFKVNADSVKKTVEAIAAEVDVAPKNATIASASNKKVSFSASAVGYQVEQESLIKNITNELEKLSAGKISASEITATVKEVQPTLHFDDLNGKIQLLASHSTTAHNTADAHHNMKNALDRCNGSVIEPGETWSFSAHAGDTNSTADGYRSATVISNGQYTQGIGGGVCQSSTTIYNAALKANLTIAERHCHRYPSSYAPAGLDATIAHPYLDLKLKNDTDYPIYLECYMTGNTLYVNFYGWQDPSFDTIKTSASITETNKADGYYCAAAERIYYKNGKEVDREALPSSRYYYPGGGSSSSETKPETTKPKATKPATPKPTTPKATQAPQTQAPATQPPATKPQVTPQPTDAPEGQNPTAAQTP